MEHSFLRHRHDDADDDSDDNNANDDDNGDDIADNDDSSLIVTMSIRRTLDDYRLVYLFVYAAASAHIRDSGVFNGFSPPRRLREHFLHDRVPSLGVGIGMVPYTWNML